MRTGNRDYEYYADHAHHCCVLRTTALRNAVRVGLLAALACLLACGCVNDRHVDVATREKAQFGDSRDHSQMPTDRNSGSIPDAAQTLAPLFLNWALTDTPLPGQPEGHDFHYPDREWLKSTLKSQSAEYVYISWNARGDEGAERFSWKYGLHSGRLHPLTVEDRATLVSRWADGTLTVAEQANFRIRDVKDGTLTVSFWIGLAGGAFPMRHAGGRFVIAGKPIIQIR